MNGHSTTAGWSRFTDADSGAAGLAVGERADLDLTRGATSEREGKSLRRRRFVRGCRSGRSAGVRAACARAKGARPGRLIHDF